MTTNNSANIATAAAGKVLQGQGVGSQNAFSTATYPSTAGTSGKVLISDGTNIVSSTPTFPNASATSGKFIRSDGTNWIASTPTLPTSAGTSGKILYSDATNYIESTPTFPASSSASSRKIIVSDGTNWVASTETWATPSTSGNVLTSDGTNWTSAAPASGTTYAINFISSTSSASIPADATNYYLNPITTWNVTNQVQTRVYIPKTGTIRQCYGAFSVGSLGSAETTTINIRLNDTTNTSIATIAFNSSPQTFNNTGLSISVTAGDYIEFYLASQTYATNPNTVTFTFSLYIS